MLKLLKYEMRKTLPAKLILLGLTACLEAYFLYGVYGKNENAANLSILLLVVLAGFGVLFIGVQSIMTLHHDMNTKQSYMLFMTPHTNYAILGAKALECTISVSLAAVFFFALGTLDINIFFGKFNIQDLLDVVTGMMKQVGIQFKLDFANIAAFGVNSVASWIETVMLAFFADVIATSLLKGKRFGGLVTFIFFILLSFGSSKLVGLIPSTNSFITEMLIQSVIMLAISVAVYFATAVVMEKKLSV